MLQNKWRVDLLKLTSSLIEIEGKIKENILQIKHKDLMLPKIPQGGNTAGTLAKRDNVAS